MAILSKKKDDLEGLKKRIDRGRERLQKIAPIRDEAFAFYRGHHFSYVDENGKLQVLPTVTSVRGTGKPRHRARQARNLIFDVVLREASSASQRVPSYQVVPSTSDPSDVGAAKLAEKVALYGYGRWGLRQATIDAVIHAVVGGEAFAWPFFDTTIGPFIEDDDGAVGQGDVRVQIFGANECFWEPGLRFEKSPYHCVEQARPIERVEQMEGYIGGKLTPDADMRSIGGRRTDKTKLVSVTDYLELPCPAYPQGRWVTMANGKRVVPDRDYPSTGEEPVLRKLSFAPDPDSDRDMGMVPQLLDPQRTKNDAENKAIEWKNMCLFPQTASAPGVFKKQRRTDEPGKNYEVMQPKENFMVLPVPPVPDSLFTMGDRAETDLLRIAGQSDPPAGADSGKAQQVWVEKNLVRSAMFVANLADWHSKVMHDCLEQVQDNYTEGRLIQIKGDFGWETIDDFVGSDLRSQVDVRVFADSIEPRTKQAIEARIMSYAQMGWVGPEQAMTAIEQGTAETIVRSFAHDEARAGRIIQRIKDGTIGEMPELPTGRLNKVPATDEMGQPVFDPMTGQPQMTTDGSPEMGPGWMPRYSDNLKVFRSIMEDWLKTEEFERIAEEVAGVADDGTPIKVHEAASTIYAGVLTLEAEKAAEAQAIQTAQAEQYGMQNASAPQGAKPLPSLPSTNGEGSTDTRVSGR